MAIEKPNRIQRDHLFISYAWEDGALAEWLSLRLTAEGYNVWCDRFKILGGESWPQDIDDAIRQRTFRMLHLVSKHSLQKPNPTKERQLALALQYERGQELFIPINVDGTKPSDLNWQLSDIAYIDFQDWGSGLRQLLKKLVSVNAPKSAIDKGRSVATTALVPTGVISTTQEQLYSNWFEFLCIPPAVLKFICATDKADTLANQLKDLWPFRRVDSQTFLSLVRPPIDSLDLQYRGTTSWANVREIEGIPKFNLIIELLNKAIGIRCQKLGLNRITETNTFFFPDGLITGNRINFLLPKEKKSWIRVASKRRFGPNHFSYNLAFVLSAKPSANQKFVAQLGLRIHIKDQNGQPLPALRAFRKSGRIRRAWWNHQHLQRQTAILTFLSGGGERVCLWDDPSTDFAFSRTPLTYNISVGINETHPALCNDVDITSVTDGNAVDDLKAVCNGVEDE